MNNVLDRDTAVFLVGVFTIIVACIMGLGTAVVLGSIAVLNLIMIASAETVRKLMGYGVLVDTLFGIAIASIAVGTLGGMTTALVAGLLYTLVRIELTKAWGSMRLSVNGATGFGAIAMEAWGWLKAKLSGGTAQFDVQWTEHQAPGGFEATNTGKVVSWLTSKAGVDKVDASWAKPAAFAAAGAASMLVLMQMSSYLVVAAVVIAVGTAAWYLRPQFVRV